LRLAYTHKKDDVNVLVYAGDGATYDSGIQSLLGAFYRRENIIYVCYNNQMSASEVRKTSSTPIGADIREKTFGNLLQSKNLEKVMLSCGASYVATACVALPDDYMEKLSNASNIVGPKFINLLCPCPIYWGFETNKGLEIGKLAVQTGVWPLYEVFNGVVRITYRPKKLRPVDDYLNKQKRFSHLNQKQTYEIQKEISKKWSNLVKGIL